MINILKKTLQIDYAYSVNSFIYTLQKLPIFNDLLTKDAYASKEIKRIVGVFGVTFSVIRAVLFKLAYYFAIFYLSTKISPNNIVKSFFHIYFILTILGIFINNKLLSISKKKYFSLILFNVDGEKFLKALILWIQSSNLILNTISIITFMYILETPNILYLLIILILTFSSRLIGEAFNIKFYKKYNYIWYSNSKLYFSIVLGLLSLVFLPMFEVYIPFSIISILTIILFILSIPCLLYLIKVKDFKLMYKQLNAVTKVMNSKNDKDYLKQAMVDVKTKDKEIEESKLKGKTGYDLFNTIFFERHKEILLRSAKKYSLVILIGYVILDYLVYTDVNYLLSLNVMIYYKLSWFIIVMFIVNRGAIITQAMFYNCDHAMLTYNFYREEKTILNLFKKRLLTVVKVNLLPALAVGFGNLSILLVSHNTNILMMISQFIFIISLSILFSVHYLVIYYLLQPFNKDMEVKKASYSFVTILTYIVTYGIADTYIETPILTLITVVVTVIYIFISMILIKKYANKTFKLN